MALSFVIDENRNEFEELTQVITRLKLKHKMKYFSRVRDAINYINESGVTPDFIFINHEMSFLKAYGWFRAIEGMPKLSETLNVLYSEKVPANIHLFPSMKVDHFYTKPSKEKHYDDILTRILFKPETPFYVLPYQFN